MKTIFNQHRGIIFSIITISILFSLFVIFWVSKTTSYITLTALNEKNELALADEIAINSICVDGEKVDIKPVNGKWFFLGSKYLWRNESDSRKPSGITSEVQLEIPSGKTREINFCSSIWRGIVKVEYDGKEQIVDTYSEKGSILKVDLGSSEQSFLTWESIKRAIIFILSFLFTGLLLLTLRQFYVKNHDRIKRYFAKHWDKFLIAFFSSIMLLFMIGYSNGKSLWSDEMFQLGAINSSLSLKESILIYAKMQDASAPLFNFVAYFWYRIVPYGQVYLLLLPEIAVSIGVYIVGMAGRKINKITGIFSALIAILISTLVLYAGHEFRPYGFLFLIVAFVIYAYITKHMLPKESKKWMIIYGVSLALLVYTHYVAVLVCFAFFIFDIILCYYKKRSWFDLLSYILGGILVVPWIIILLIYNQREVTSFWPAAPNLKSISKLFEYLSGSNDLLYYLFLFGIAISIVVFVAGIVKKNYDFLQILLPFAFTINVVITIFVIYVYSAIINPSGSLFVSRYFIMVIPQLVLLSGIVLGRLSNHISGLLQSWSVIKICAVLCCFITLSCGIQFAVRVESDATTIHEPFKESADWVMSRSDIYSPQTAVMLTNSKIVTDGFDDYYISKKGLREGVDVYSQKHLAGQYKKLLDYNTLYIISYHSCLSNEMSAFLDDKYELVTLDSPYEISKYIKIID